MEKPKIVKTNHGIILPFGGYKVITLMITLKNTILLSFMQEEEGVAYDVHFDKCICSPESAPVKVSCYETTNMELLWRLLGEVVDQVHVTNSGVLQIRMVSMEGIDVFPDPLLEHWEIRRLELPHFSMVSKAGKGYIMNNSCFKVTSKEM